MLRGLLPALRPRGRRSGMPDSGQTRHRSRHRVRLSGRYGLRRTPCRGRHQPGLRRRLHQLRSALLSAGIHPERCGGPGGRLSRQCRAPDLGHPGLALSHQPFDRLFRGVRTHPGRGPGTGPATAWVVKGVTLPPCTAWLSGEAGSSGAHRVIPAGSAGTQVPGMAKTVGV